MKVLIISLLWASPIFSQDYILMRNGDEEYGKIFEVEQDKIKYKKKSMPDSPIFTIDKKDVFMVKYKNGTKEVFKLSSEVKKSEVENSSESKAKQPSQTPVQNNNKSQNQSSKTDKTLKSDPVLVKDSKMSPTKAGENENRTTTGNNSIKVQEDPQTINTKSEPKNGLSSNSISKPILLDGPDEDLKKIIVPPGKALIYIVRPSVIGLFLPIKIYCDNALMGTTIGKKYICIQVEAGSHIIATQAENKDETSINIEKDKAYFIEQNIKLGVLTARCKLSQLSLEQGKEVLSKCNKMTN